MVGENLGSFRIEGTLGVGAMGVVYKATHEPTGKPAAVKVVSKEIHGRGNAFGRFQREAEILKQFRHPNIVRFLALGRYQGTSYIAMEFIQGQTLEQLLVERGPMPWKEVVELGIQLCDALHYAHEHGVVHRDLKPSNLMVTEDGRLKLTDFGIAKDLDKTALTATGRTLGTAAYMAPEQIRGTPEISHKTDLYALGVVLYQMLTGQTPFEGTTAVVLMHSHLNQPAPRPSKKLYEIPKALDDLVVALMAKSPNDRPWDAVAVGETLRTIRDTVAGGETLAMAWPTEAADAPGATRAGESSKRSKKGRRSKGSATPDKPRAVWIAETAGLVLALLVIGGVIAYALWPPGIDHLYRHAERLMASKQRHDWYEARDRYFGPLDTRFPNHPYREKTRAWRDRILLADTEGRARTLQSAANTKLNVPNDANEERFVEYYALVSADQKRGDDLAAVGHWEELAHLYRPDEPGERAWYLLANRRADELRAAIAKRREMVTKLLEQAHQAERNARHREAEGIRAEVVNRYGQFTDLADLLGTPPSTSTAPAPVVPAPASPAATPTQGTAPKPAGPGPS